MLVLFARCKVIESWRTIGASAFARRLSKAGKVIGRPRLYPVGERPPRDYSAEKRKTRSRQWSNKCEMRKRFGVWCRSCQIDSTPQLVVLSD
jgi:hypothetical protein